MSKPSTMRKLGKIAFRAGLDTARRAMFWHPSDGGTCFLRLGLTLLNSKQVSTNEDQVSNGRESKEGEKKERKSRPAKSAGESWYK